MTTKTAPKKAPAKKAPARNVKAAPQKKIAAEAPRKVSTNTHLDAGLNLKLYDGPSSFVNSNRKVKIMLGREVEASKLTSRAQQGFYALRKCYGKSAFEPKGFDNGILRDLVGAGLITVSNGQKQTIDGKEYMLDGATSVRAQITAAGMNYGKAA